MKSFLKKIRMFFLLAIKYKIRKVGKGFYIGRRNLINCNDFVVGDYVFIGNNCHISVEKLVIEDYVMLASQVSIVGGDHKFDVVGTPIRFTGRDKRNGVTIKRDSWIGHGAIILDGVTIEEGSIIAAGAVVTRNTECYSINAGLPAKKIKNRFLHISDQEKHIKALNTKTFK